MYQFLVSFEQVDDVFGTHSVACDDPGPVWSERGPSIRSHLLASPRDGPSR